MRLGLQAFTDSSEATLFADWTSRASNVRAETDHHGFANLSCFVRYPLYEAFRIYDAVPLGHVVLSAGGWRVFEGRIEDRRLVDGGIEIGAYGYWRRMSDYPYVSLWTDTSYGNWAICTDDDLGTMAPEVWELDNNNRLYYAMREGENYANNSSRGAWFYEMPHRGRNNIAVLSFDYDVTLPTNWRVRIRSFATGFASAVVEATVVTGDGSNQTGSHSETITASKDIVLIEVENNTGGGVDYASNTGTDYAKITNIVVKATSSATIYADEIIDDLVARVTTANQNQLSSSTGLIESPNVALTDEIYEDRTPADIADELASRGDDATPPNLYEVGVWENQLLHFRQKGKYGMDWYADIASLEIESTLDNLWNNTRGIYADARGFRRSTTLGSDSESVALYGITRRIHKRIATTSATIAGIYRDAILEDNKDITPRARIVLSGLYNASGGRVPSWMMRAGDTLTIRNLPPGAGTAIDKIRKFRVRRTSYDVDNDILTPEPELEAPSLEFLVAQNMSRLESFIRIL